MMRAGNIPTTLAVCNGSEASESTQVRRPIESYESLQDFDDAFAPICFSCWRRPFKPSSAAEQALRDLLWQYDYNLVHQAIYECLRDSYFGDIDSYKEALGCVPFWLEAVAA